LRRSAYDADLAAYLRALAECVRRNVPLRRDPERFHVERTCICQDLEHLAAMLDERQERKLEITRKRKPVVTWGL
jgi:hypothetical protein